MLRLEALLKTGPLIITMIWLAATFVPALDQQVRAFSGAYGSLTVTPVSIGTVLWLFFLVWDYALYQASHRRTAPEQRRDRLGIFIAMVFATAALLPLSHILYHWNGSPPAFLLILMVASLVPSVFSVFASMWAASDALRRFEISSPDPADATPWNPLFAILFIPIGIWFIYKRIQRMLDHPDWTDQRT